jgi:uncharacterized membrane protein SpoIIM required for sporulation
MSILNQLLNSPLLLILAVALFLVSCITTLDARIVQGKRSGELPADQQDLPEWVSVLHVLDWGLFITLLILNWHVGLLVWVVLFALKVLPVLETIGNILMRPARRDS